MSDQKRHVERLIEDGLVRYGQGDLSGALATWERALIQDPGNLQAIGYIEYVRRVFEQFNRPTRDEMEVPFGLGHGDHPDYQIEISPEPPDDDALQPIEPLQDGWLIAQDDERDTIERLYSLAEPPGTLDLEYDDPPAAMPPAAADAEHPADFGDTTPAVASELPVLEAEADGGDAFEGPELEVTPGFLEAASATPGFGDRVDVTPDFSDAAAGTDLRRPELGFVQARAGRPGAVRRRAPSSMDAVAEPATARLTGPAVSAPIVPTAPTVTPAGPAEVAAPPQSTAAHRAVTSPGLLDPWSELAEVNAPAGEDPGDASLNLAPYIEELPPATDTGDGEPSPQARLRPETLTRNLGLAGRYRPRADSKFGEESPTRELPRHPTEDDETTQAWAGGPPPPPPSSDALETLAVQILPMLDRDVRVDERRDDRLRRRIVTLVELGSEWIRIGDARRAVAAADLALAEDPDSVLAQKLVHRNREAILAIFQTFLGSLERRPCLARSLDDLGSSPIGARAAFLLSRVDGHLTFDEILDVSGMPRLEAYRYLCQLLIRGILTVE